MGHKLQPSVLSKSFVSIARSLTPRNLRQRLRVMPWLEVRGDKTLRLDYELTTDSIVFDLGGYEGNWASDIYAIYRCKVYVFEPVPIFYDFISNRFRRNQSIHAFQYGLSDANRSETIELDGDASSISARQKRWRMPSARQIAIRLRSISEFLEEQNIDHVDLMKINIEGGEYDLLEHIIASNQQHRLHNIQIQFHDSIPDAEERMARIQRGLSSSHHVTFQFPFVWENWEINR